jgi:hypothetical protein
MRRSSRHLSASTSRREHLLGNRLFGNQREHPQVLVWGFPPDEFQAIEGVFTGAKRIFALDDAHQAEWDLLIARDQDLVQVKPDLFVIAFGGTVIGWPAEIGRPTGTDRFVVRDLQEDPPKGRSRFRSVATKFEAPATVPARFLDLIADDLVPLLEGETSHSCLLGYTRTDEGISAPSFEIPGIESLIQGSDGATYAAHFRMRGGKGWCLTLPLGASPRWIAAAVSHWHTVDRKRFPGTLDWMSKTIKWLTPEELEAARRWAAATEASEAVKAAEKVAQDEFYKAREAAAAGAFRLLTAGDRPLEEAVRDAFTDLGFMVHDMDQERPEDDRLEDLRVSPPDRPEWVALVEIKGYLRSRGKAEDVINLTARFGRRFREAEKRDPDAYWYVVNHEMGVDPEARKLVFEGSDGELRSFASAGGLAIDTRDLFCLWRAVRLGNLSADEARAKFVGFTGRFLYVLESEPEAGES